MLLHPILLPPQGRREHLPRYPKQARSHAAADLKGIGHSGQGGRAMSSYGVEFADGTFRMLSVIRTDDGLKVDWDSYARYCSAGWQQLFSGAATRAEVRVFVRPGDYHVGRFRDPREWTCFKLETPDSDRFIYGYVPAGSDLARELRDHVMKSRIFRQHMTLGIHSEAESGKDALFIIDELLAMGWIRN